MADWKIHRRHGECSRCEAAFEDGQRLASLLRIDGEQSLLREDLCQACWDAGDPESYLFWWFTRHHPTRSKTVQLDLGSLERLFMELANREEGSLRELRYLLCLLLMRKRKLKLVKVQRGKDGERLLLRRPRRQEEIPVDVFDFTSEKLEELRTRLQEVLDGAGPLAEEELGADEASAADPEGPEGSEGSEGNEGAEGGTSLVAEASASRDGEAEATDPESDAPRSLGASAVEA